MDHLSDVDERGHRILGVGQRTEEGKALLTEPLRLGDVAADPGGCAERVRADRLCGHEPVLARKGERGRIEARGTRAVVVGDLDRGAEMERPPLERGIAQSAGERQRLLYLREAVARVSRSKLDRGMAEQCLDALGRVVRHALERLSEPVARLRQLDPAEPERPHGRRETECLGRLRLEERLEGRAKIPLLGLETRQLLVEPLDELHEPGRMPSCHGATFA